MAQRERRRIIVIILIVLIIVILLLLTRCLPKTQTASPPPAPTPAATAPIGNASARPDTPAPAEILTSATLAAPERVAAGTAFVVTWTGPDNDGDFVNIVSRESPANTTGNYRETKAGKSLQLTAPMDPGPHEVRYVTARTRTILARATVEVEPVTAALEAAAEVMLGAPFPVRWTGPNNKGDYVTIVPRSAPDAQYASYAETEKGPALTLTAPTEAGDFELRYVSGQGRKVLARRPIKVAMPQVTLAAPAEAVAGSTIEVTWTGPDNSGDYITLVAPGTPEGQYGNYTNTSQGSPLKLLTPVTPGDAELRYVAGHNTLAHRSIRLIAPQVTLAGPRQAAPGVDVSITWTGPNYPGDYITIVAKDAADGQYGDYAETSQGSPLTIKAPKDPGDAEIRYVAAQGGKVLARIPITISP